MTLVNHVEQIQAECTRCDKSLVAHNGDVIIILPQKLMGKWELVVLCEPCYKIVTCEEAEE